MRTGIYAVVARDGTRLEPVSEAQSTSWADCGPFARFTAVDREGLSAHSVAVSGHRQLFFVGDLEDPAALATQLGLDQGSNAELALAALNRWDAECFGRLAGHWSLQVWDAARQQLTIAVSPSPRDLVFYAADAHRITVGPEVGYLISQPWVGRDIDPAGFALGLSRARIRKRMGARTAFVGVKTVQAGTAVTIGPAGEVVTPFNIDNPIPWRGDFEDAVETLESLLRASVRRRIAGHKRIAILLSGGLDSSILAWIVAGEARSDQEVFCLTSAAPPGSNLPDETVKAAVVASALGLPIAHVSPGPEFNIYRPTAETFAHDGSPLVSPRHYLYEALFAAARERGATAVLDGGGGENSITRAAENPSIRRVMIDWARSTRASLSALAAQKRPAESEHDADFHARLRPAFLAGIPGQMFEPDAAAPEPGRVSLSAPMGFAANHQHALGTSAAVAGGGLLWLFPYRDLNLMRVSAGMPGAFTVRNGLTRAIGREMLRGRLPDHIRLETRTVAFSPDYNRRLMDGAKAMSLRAARLEQRAIDAIDLEWLARAEAHLLCAQGSIREYFRVQMTACAAEFVEWAAPE